MPHRPILLGVVGDSAAGKTTLSTGVAELLGGDAHVTVICTDDYHRYNRVERKARGITPLHPDCNYIDILEQHLETLADGRPILKPVYNHRVGDFDPPVYVKPQRFVIVEGLLGFHTPAMRSCYHVKVFLDPPETLRRRWKVSRDCAKRGYSPEEVLAELERRETDSATFIRTQQAWADLVVRFFPPAEPPDAEHLNARVTLRSTLAHPDLTRLQQSAGEAGGVLRLAVGREHGRLVELLEIAGTVSASEAVAIQGAIWRQHPSLELRRA